MGFGNVGWSGMVLVLVALLLVFGPSKLPEIGKAFGKSLREFKTATKGLTEDTLNDTPNEHNPSTAQAKSVEPITLLTDQESTPKIPSTHTN